MGAGLKWKAVAYGVAVDLLGTVVATLVVSIQIGVVLGLMGWSPEHLERWVSASLPMITFLQVIGLYFSFAGGYVAAAVANELERRHAVAVASISLVIAILSQLGVSEAVANAPSLLPFWAAGLLSCAAVYYGGVVRESGMLDSSASMVETRGLLYWATLPWRSLAAYFRGDEDY